MISSKFQRNKRCTCSFENNFRFHPILHHTIVALRVSKYPGSAFHVVGLAVCNKLSGTCNAFLEGPRAGSLVTGRRQTGKSGAN